MRMAGFLRNRSTPLADKKGSSKSPPFSLVHSVHASERLFTDENLVHTFEVSTGVMMKPTCLNF